MKLGKKPAAPRPKDFKFGELISNVTLPKLPRRFGYGKMFTDWGMLGNGPDDTVEPGFHGAGDCVLAGACHEIRMINHLVLKRDIPFTGKEAIAAYSDVAGYVLGDDTTDNGTDMHDAANYRLKTGVADANGERHKIAAYVFLDPQNTEHLQVATMIFLACGFGFRYPHSAWAQFHAGEPWDVVPNDGGIEGGHYVPDVGSMDSTAKGTGVTWAKRQEFTHAFYEKYNDEAVVYITEEELRADAKDVHGFDMQKLQSFLDALKQ